MSYTFDKPHHPIGYIMFEYESGNFRGRYNHISDIQEFALKHNIDPTDVVVFRVFYPDKLHADRKLMKINEYAYEHIVYEQIGEFQVEHSVWKWEPQSIEDKQFIQSDFFSNLKLKIYNFAIKIQQIFPV